MLTRRPKFQIVSKTKANKAVNDLNFKFYTTNGKKLAVNYNERLFVRNLSLELNPSKILKSASGKGNSPIFVFIKGEGENVSLIVNRDKVKLNLKKSDAGRDLLYFKDKEEIIAKLEFVSKNSGLSLEGFKQESAKRE